MLAEVVSLDWEAWTLFGRDRSDDDDALARESMMPLMFPVEFVMDPESAVQIIRMTLVEIGSGCQRSVQICQMRGILVHYDVVSESSRL